MHKIRQSEEKVDQQLERFERVQEQEMESRMSQLSSELARITGRVEETQEQLLSVQTQNKDQLGAAADEEIIEKLAQQVATL